MRQDSGTASTLNHMSGNLAAITGAITDSSPNAPSSSRSNPESGQSHALDEMHHMTFAELY